MFKSCETAVSTCAGANGFAINTLFGTPNDAQSWPSAPVTQTTGKPDLSLFRA